MTSFTKTLNTTTRLLRALRIGLICTMVLMTCVMVPKANAELNVDRAMVTQAVIDHIRQAATEQQIYNEATDDLEVNIPHLPSSALYFNTGNPTDVAKIRVESNLSQYFTPHGLVNVTMTLPSGESQRVGVPVRITLLKTVWKVKRQIRPGEAFSSKNLSHEKLAITQQFKDVVPANTNLSKKTARLVLIPGTILKKSQYTQPIAVKSQGFVRIVMSGPKGLHMVLEGKALENGHIGDIIRVKSRFNTQKLYTGKVIGTNRVAVSF